MRNAAGLWEHPCVFRRSANDRIALGVAGGIGERLGIDPVVVRLAFVVLSLAAGVGILLYVALALVSRAPEPGADVPRARTSARQAIAVTLVVVGSLILLRRAGLWFGDRVVWPAAVAALGSAVLWARGDEANRERWARLVHRLPDGIAERLAGRAIGVRMLVGGAFVVLGVAAFLSSNPGSLVRPAPAVAVTLAGLTVVIGPWVWRLVRQTTEERRERIRQEERAEMAAHLHDSVLQTLALIQRSGDSDEMTALARVQERELRTWLYGKHPVGAASLSAALDAVVAEIERSHRARIELVVVGDCDLDEGVRALVHACREAIVNAAMHSGTRGVSVYVEVEPDAVTAFVRDHGVGFSRAGISADRRGIAESIEGRMQRNGGVAVVESRPGAGTEVALRIPLVRG
jgi:signal transduction histidine kinase